MGVLDGQILIGGQRWPGLGAAVAPKKVKAEENTGIVVERSPLDLIIGQMADNDHRQLDGPMGGRDAQEGSHVIPVKNKLEHRARLAKPRIKKASSRATTSARPCKMRS
jgi:hypothetical protein